MKPLFVTGIGTGIGKTIAAAILTEKLQADYWKPIQAGDLENSDSATVKKLISNKKSICHPERYRLHTPASPHYAAEMEGIEISLDDFKLPTTNNLLVIEGAGGLLVPLNRKGDYIADFIKLFDAEVVLVVQNYLGAINHTMLSLSYLKYNNIPVKGIIINGAAMPSTESYIGSLPQMPIIGRIFNEDIFKKQTVINYANAFIL